MKITGYVLATVILCSGRCALAAPILIIDQQNLVAPDSSGPVIPVGSSFGQGFTPALLGIDAAELRIRTSGTSSQVRLDVVAGSGTVGAALASATQTIANVADAVIHFDFPARVPLVPGNPYTLRFVYVSGNAPLYAVNRFGDPYAGGIGYDVDNFPRPEADFWFVEGMHVPEPAAWALAPWACIWLGWRRRHLSRR